MNSLPHKENETKERKLSEIMRDSGSISVPKALIQYFDEGRNFGLIRATALTEIISKYDMWKEKGGLQADGSFYYTAEEMENDTGISINTQKTNVFPYLEKLGLLIRDSRRKPRNKWEQTRFIILNEKKCMELFTTVIPNFKEKLEKEKRIKEGENPNKARDGRMVENQPIGRVNFNQPDGGESTSSNTVLNNTRFSNTDDTPLPPQYEERSYKDKGQKEEIGAGGIYEFIQKNFSEEIQSILLSAEQYADPKHFTIPFLKAFKEAYRKTLYLEIDPLRIRGELVDIFLDMQDDITIRDLTGLMIYRFRNPDRKQESAKKKQPISVKDQIGESSFEPPNLNPYETTVERRRRIKAEIGESSYD